MWMVQGSIPWACGEVGEMEKMIKHGVYTIPRNLDQRIAKMIQRLIVVEPRDRRFPTDEELEALGPALLLTKPESRRRSEAIMANQFREAGKQRFLSASQLQSIQAKRRNSGAPVTLRIPRLYTLQNHAGLPSLMAHAAAAAASREQK